MTKKEALKNERMEAKEALLQILQAGNELRFVNRIHVINRYTSQNGMNRVISCHVLKDGELYNVSWRVAKALGWNYSDRYQGVKVGGCGMDMGFHLVYQLSHELFGDGYKLSRVWV